MKSAGAVRHKLKQVTYRHLQREIRTSLSCRPENCIHNRAVRLPSGDLRFCQLHTDRDGGHIVCDEAYGGLSQASGCKDFQCNTTKEEVKERFQSFLRTSDLGSLAVRYPDIAALSWALGEDAEMILVQEEDGPSLTQTKTEPSKGETPREDPQPSTVGGLWTWRSITLTDGEFSVIPVRQQSHRGVVNDYGVSVSFPLR